MLNGKKHFFLNTTLLFLLLLVVGFIYLPKVSHAESDQEKLDRLSQEIQKYQAEITRLSSLGNTLTNQIAQYDTQIKLTTLKIEETEEKIMLLGGRIDQLETSLDELTQAFTSRVVQSYKMVRLHEPLVTLVGSLDLTSMFSNYEYLKKIEESDRGLLLRLESAQANYKDEKVSQEDLQNELQNQKNVLDGQKKAKAALLIQTKNNEKKYQELLTSARSEYEAIQAIITGHGQESLVGKVSQGDKIATIIQGASCNSSGEHLHFMVTQNASTVNPFSMLKSGVDYENCSGSSCGSNNSDPFNPSGSWDWPLNPKVEFFQGYGVTWAVKNTWAGKVYSFHNGIDIDSKTSNDVKAVKSGTLYRGSYTGVNGCRLRYVRIDHEDSNYDTYYLHVNY